MILARAFAGASMVGGLLLLVATVVTGADVLSRWLLNKPVYFAIEFSALAIGAGVMLAFPSRFMERDNVSAHLLATVLSKRMNRALQFFGAAVSALMMTYVAYIIILQANDKLGLSERTPDMALPTGPLWVLAAVVMVLAAIGSVIALLSFRGDKAA